MDLFPERDTFFAHVLLPVPIDKLFTYRVPKALEENVKELHRVIVPFGPKKILTGIVRKIDTKPPLEHEAKLILEALDSYPVLTPQQMSFFDWMAAYYMCTPGEVLNAALPSGLKLSSESLVQLNPSFDFEKTDQHFSEKEWSLLHRLKSDTLTYTEVSKFLGVKSIYTLLRSLNAKNAILLLEEIKEKYQPKRVPYIRLSKSLLEKKKLEALFRELESKPKQEAVLLKYLQHVPVFSIAALNQTGMKKSELLGEDLSASSLTTLIKQGVIEEFEVIVPRFDLAPGGDEKNFTLSNKQEAALQQTLAAFDKKKPVLLFGVTGSGKTEIYIDLMLKALAGGSQVLLLLPEIALTTQMVGRLKKVFGSKLGVYHSRFSDNERVEVWRGVVDGKFDCIAGVRSAVFLPFDNLGLIIVDEEHDTSYKQDRAPRYNARDAALMLSRIHQSQIILGSATPSAESYYQASQGKFQMVELQERFGDTELPGIELVNLVEERKRKSLKGAFSSVLLREISTTVSQKEQVILFQNRRGYSPFIECEDCGFVPACINCAVSLTYHQYRHALICHYCGYKENVPASCPTCSSKRLKTMGYGTEQLEEEIKLHFPDARVMRMDLDTTRSKTGYEKIIESFEKGETDIMVGTQMVSKGLDFGHVSLAGVFDADRLMHFPDFRSYERAFSLMTQVSGRSGRRSKKGKVIIQTSNPEHPLFSYLVRHDVSGFLQHQLEDRQAHFFPPFSRLVEITFKHSNKKICQEAAEVFVKNLRKSNPAIKVLGPGEPMVSKIRNDFLFTALIKIGRDHGQLDTLKARLVIEADAIISDKKFRSLKIIFDVDPL